MKIRVQRTSLAEGLAVCSACLTAKAIRPVLQNIKLSAVDGQLDVQATDLEMCVRHLVAEVEILEEGEVLVPGKQFQDIVRESFDEALEITSTGSSCKIEGKDSTFEIVTEDVADFPALPQRTSDGAVELPAEDFKQMIDQTIFAVGVDNPRAALTGVLISREKNKVEMVATDGRRLALVRRKIKNPDEKDQQMIVPAKALRELVRGIAADDSVVSLVCDDKQNQIIFQTNRTLVSSVLIDAQFPAYKDVLPKELNKKVSLNRLTLASAIRRAALVTSEESRAVELDFTDKVLVVRSKAPERGNAEVRIPNVVLEGGPLKINFNPDFLSDVLKVLTDEEVTLQFKDGDSASQLVAGGDFRYVIMPIKPIDI